MQHAACPRAQEKLGLCLDSELSQPQCISLCLCTCTALLPARATSNRFWLTFLPIPQAVVAEDKDCRVLDLGAGAGLHAMLALRAGAHHVTAVERWLYLALACKECMLANEVGVQHASAGGAPIEQGGQQACGSAGLWGLGCSSGLTTKCRCNLAPATQPGALCPQPRSPGVSSSASPKTLFLRNSSLRSASRWCTSGPQT